jgi:HAD superfamily phosphoserine phosphatase-like hydrolase
MTNETKNIALFDVCDTLYYSNTTFDFIYFYVKNYSPENLPKFKRLLNKNSLGFWFNIALAKFLGNDVIRNRAVKMLKGVSKQELYKAGKEFTEVLTSQRKIEETHRLMEAYQGNGYQIVLCSASIDPVVHNIAADLDATYYCTMLGYDANDICTGIIVRDLTGKKYDALQHDMGLDGVAQIAAVSDNSTDRPLLAMAHQKHIVVYQEADKDLWGGMDGSFILLKKRPYLYE